MHRLQGTFPDDVFAELQRVARQHGHEQLAPVALTLTRIGLAQASNSGSLAAPLDVQTETLRRVLDAFGVPLINQLKGALRASMMSGGHADAVRVFFEDLLRRGGNDVDDELRWS